MIQGLFTARPTPRLEYEVADAQHNSLTPPGNGVGGRPTHTYRDRAELRSPSYVTPEMVWVIVCAAHPEEFRYIYPLRKSY